MTSASWPGTRCAPRPGQLAQRVVGLVHLGQVGDDAEGPVALELLVEVHARRRRARPSPPMRVDAERDLPGRVAAEEDRVHALGDLLAALQAAHAPGVDRGEDLAQLARLDRVGELRAARERAEPEVEVARRDEQLGVGEEVEVAGVVVVQVREHDARDGLRADPERRHRRPPARSGSVRPRRRPTSGSKPVSTRIVSSPRRTIQK